MFAFEILAEQKIKEAMKNGEFDNLRGKGKPLPKDNLDNVPAELWMACKILKNAGVLPEELELKKEIYNINQLIDACMDEDEKNILRKKLSQKQLRYNMLMERKGAKISDYEYRKKIMEKLSD